MIRFNVRPTWLSPMWKLTVLDLTALDTATPISPLPSRGPSQAPLVLLRYESGSSSPVGGDELGGMRVTGGTRERRRRRGGSYRGGGQQTLHQQHWEH